MAVLPHISGVVYYHLLLRREMRDRCKMHIDKRYNLRQQYKSISLIVSFLSIRTSIKRLLVAATVSPNNYIIIIMFLLTIGNNF